MRRGAPHLIDAVAASDDGADAKDGWNYLSGRYGIGILVGEIRCCSHRFFLEMRGRYARWAGVSRHSFIF